MCFPSDQEKNTKLPYVVHIDICISGFLTCQHVPISGLKEGIPDHQSFLVRHNLSGVVTGVSTALHCDVLPLVLRILIIAIK